MQTSRAADQANAARLLGSILLVVVRGYEQAAIEAESCEEVLTTAALAAETGASESQVRVMASKLTRNGCLCARRVTVSHGADSRRVQGYQLPPPAERRGNGRKPRWQPVALVVGPDVTASAHTLELLLSQGVLPVFVTNCACARRLLAYLAFEVVVVSQSALSTHAAESELAAIRQAARQASCGNFLVLASTQSFAHLSAASAPSDWRGSLVGGWPSGGEELASMF